MRGMLGTPVGRWSGPQARPAREIACIRHELPSGNHAGGASAGAWGNLPLNTIHYDPQGLVKAVYSDGAFLLDSGKYLVKARCPLMNVNEFEIRLYDVTLGVAAVDGGSGYTYASNAYDMTTALLRGELNIARATRLALQQISATSETTWSRGHAGSQGTEVYAWIWIRKWRT